MKIHPTPPGKILSICRLLKVPIRGDREYWTLDMGEHKYNGFYTEGDAELAGYQLTNKE